jgi:5-methylcytosine-specific restriction endonuclease McrA
VIAVPAKGQFSARVDVLRMQGAVATSPAHTEAEWLAMIEIYKGRCAHCKKRTRLTRDHIIPISGGGTDEITNIQPLCRPCNSRKGAKRTQLL